LEGGALNKYSKITGTGSCVPEKVLTNADLEKMVDTSDQWITERTGIKERRISAADEGTSDLGATAAIRAIEMANVSPEEIDLIICATTTPDYKFPATACVIQEKIGAKNAASFDVQAACSGFLYGIHVADGLIKSTGYKKVLLIGADTLSSMTNYKDRETCILFGDGAGAVIMEPSEEPGIMSTHTGCYSDKWKLLNCMNGGSKTPITKENLGSPDNYIKMQGREIFKNAVSGMAKYSQMAIEENGLTTADISHVIPHQANNRIIEALAKKFDAPMSKFVVNLDKYGNTSSASIPLALDEANREGRFKKDEFMLFGAFGAGLTVASTLIKWRMGD
jgi:3-oxoacyl-[acyl-carrier-protein] synthase-3